YDSDAEAAICDVFIETVWDATWYYRLPLDAPSSASEPSVSMRGNGNGHAEPRRSSLGHGVRAPGGAYRAPDSKKHASDWSSKSGTTGAVRIGHRAGAAGSLMGRVPQYAGGDNNHMPTDYGSVDDAMVVRQQRGGGGQGSDERQGAALDHNSDHTGTRVGEPSATGTPVVPFQLGTWAMRQQRLLAQTVADEAAKAVRVVKKQVSKSKAREEQQAGMSPEGGQAADGAGAADDGEEDEEGGVCASVDASSLVAQFLMEESEQRKQRRDSDAAAFGEADVVDAAWRWRFARRWNAEQCREPVETDSFVEGPGVQPRGNGNGNGNGAADSRQPEGFARQASEDILMLMSSLGHSLNMLGGSLELGSEGGSSGRLGQRLSGTATHGGSDSVAALNAGGFGRQRSGRATLEAVSAAAKANTLNVSSMIPTVEVDAFGAYPFILVTMRNLAGQSCILLHGHNNATHESLLESSKRTTLHMASAHGLRGETTVILGGGMMEWCDGSEGRARDGSGVGGARARGGKHAPGSSGGNLHPAGPPDADEAPSVRLSMGMACGNGVSGDEVLSITASLLRPTLPSRVAVLVADGPPGDAAGAAVGAKIAGNGNARSGGAHAVPNGALAAKLQAMRG
ncbi:hypothetical protein FOA52_011445, partial [Chlamydomonas sp. UWO 241]